MTDEELKSSIQKFADKNYKGKFRPFKPKLLTKVVGVDGFNRIHEIVHEDLHTPLSLLLYCFVNNINTAPTCPCGTPTKFNTSKVEFGKYCSNKCRFSNMEDVIEIRKATNLQKYGASNFLASREGREKIAETNMTRYGVDNYTKTEQYKQTVRGKKPSTTTNTRRILSQLRKTYESLPTKFPRCIPKFSLEEYTGVKGYVQYRWECVTCGREFTSSFDNGSSPICNHCAPVGTKWEKYVMDRVIEPYVHNYRKIPSGREIDIYFPDKKFGVEMCGLYWHSEKVRPNKNEHVSKLDECSQTGIRLFTVFDDEMYDTTKRRIVMNKINHALGGTTRKIFARKCSVVELSSEFVTKFMSKYHIQGSIGSSYRYGLICRGKVVAVMTFNKGRMTTGHKKEENVFELGRYATVFNFSVVGGSGKLLSHFVRTIRPAKIFSYADRRWSDGNLYEKLGFTFVKNTTPNYWYTKTFTTREHRTKYQKHKLHADDPNKTEKDIMCDLGYTRIWDCGSKLYTMENFYYDRH